MVWVDNTRILAIFAVVFLHVAADVVIGVGNFNSSQWWIGNIYDALVRWCVPVFVMLSGALLLSDDKTESLPEFYKKRVARLLVPILSWSIFFLAWTFLKGLVRGNAPSLLSLSKNLLFGNPYPHMWFLYMIVGLYFITPFVRTLVRHTSRSEIIFFVIILFGISAVNSAYDSLYAKNTTLFINWCVSYLPYFILGHLIAKSDWEPKKIIVLLVFALSVLLPALGCFLLGKSYGLEKGLYFYSYLSITVIPMSISIMFLLKKLNIPILNIPSASRLAGLSLGVYLVHPVILELLGHCGIYVLKFNPLISFSFPYRFRRVYNFSNNRFNYFHSPVS